MKNLQKISIYIIIFFSLIGIFKVFKKVNVLKTSSDKNRIINDYARKLKGCFDLENITPRRIHESLDLIAYCMKEFGID